MAADLNKWYQTVYTRRVDLVGDYAGTEIFLVEGDSLLLEVFSDPQLRFDGQAFQLLHAAYSVERFLKQLISRSCRFDIVFFDDHEQLSIPASAASTDAPKYLLARAAIIRHLEQNLTESVKIHRYQSITEPSFLESLNDVYFVMAHDGDGCTEPVKASFRYMLRWLISKGWNIALVNTVEFQDTKAMTMVLEERRNPIDLPRPAPVESAANTPKIDMSLVNVDDFYKLCKKAGLEPSEREALTLTSISLLIKSQKITVDEAANVLRHTAALRHVSLADRRLKLEAQRSDNDEVEVHEKLLSSVIQCSIQLLSDRGFVEALDEAAGVCDLADYVDGNLLAAFRKADEHALSRLPKACTTRFEEFTSLVSELTQAEFPTSAVPPTTSPAEAKAPESRRDSGAQVLPFSHPIFDEHLKSIHLSIDASEDSKATTTEDRIFKELSHWHNAKRPLVVKGPPNEILDKKARRRNDRLMAEMTKYSASLTNASGNVLDPETLVVRTAAAAPSAPTKQVHHTQKKAAAGKTKPGAAPAKSNKERAHEAAAALKATKSETKDAQFVTAWRNAYREMEKIPNQEEQYLKADKYLRGLTEVAKTAVEPEIELFKAVCLFNLGQEADAKPTKSSGSATNAQPVGSNTSSADFTALIWDIALKLRRTYNDLPKSITTTLDDLLKASSLPALNIPASETDRKLQFKGPNPSKTKAASRDSLEFQLEHCGPYFDRSFDAAKDARVPFAPDAWQRQVLDAIDARKSLLAIAPTSSGKTFISFYAMKQILQSGDDGVLVYVAPTKALVNQIAAEVQARFSKTFKMPGKSVWGIHTRDHRVNNPIGCQVLVTVPAILQILLLSPTHATDKNSWATRVQTIIFDEVHCIGQAEDGLIWEQLLLLAPCPIIALSATVGNPEALGSWLESTQKDNNFVTIQHKTRYSDLRKFIYNPPKQFGFDALEHRSTISTPGLNGSAAFAYVHPVAGLVDKSRGIPEDLALEPADCLTLYRALLAHQTKEYPVKGDLAPKKVLPTIIRKADILKWEQSLKTILKQWMRDPASPFDAVLADLSKTSTSMPNRGDVQSSTALTTPRKVAADDLTSTTLPLLVDLHYRNALPAILFNFDRSECERIAAHVLTDLQSSEDIWKSKNAAWKKKLAAWEDWKSVQDKLAEKAKKAPAGKDKAKKKRGDDDEDGGSKADKTRDAASQQTSWQALFDPKAPQEGFHFANWKMLLPSEFAEYKEELEYRRIPDWLIQALERGIGVHHAGMNRKYRQVVEMLFRKGFLRVVIATGTLALGINMPCKTVVFSGDSVFLTALNFRQSAGRAGRRGFDVLGNVVFQCVPYEKVCRLLSSRLPDLHGHFPITTSLVLRLFTLLHETKNSEYATQAVNSLLAQPRLYLGGEEAKMTVLHHLRFSIEYLRRSALLGEDGAPLNFSGLVSHLYYTENSGFAFHALLKGGYFHNLCAGVDRNPKKVLLELMLTLSHLFGRMPCKRADKEFIEEVVKRSPSKVFLEPMPAAAEGILRKHNDDTLEIYRTYVDTFVDQHIEQPDRSLPLSGLTIGEPESGKGTALPGALPAVRIRSPFVALSGHGDDFTSIHDLCSTVRSGVFLEENVIPYVALYPQESDVPLNAYLLDYFKHGSVVEMDRANGIRKGNIWFVLNDFSLVLATIIASLENFMKLTSADDDLDIRGSGDAAEELAGESETQDSGYGTAENSIDEDESDSDLTESIASMSLDNGQGLLKVLKAFRMLRKEFDEKFRAMWA